MNDTQANNLVRAIHEVTKALQGLEAKLSNIDTRLAHLYQAVAANKPLPPPAPPYPPATRRTR